MRVEALVERPGSECINHRKQCPVCYAPDRDSFGEDIFREETLQSVLNQAGT
jgi:hypothetical protein